MTHTTIFEFENVNDAQAAYDVLCDDYDCALDGKYVVFKNMCEYEDNIVAHDIRDCAGVDYVTFRD